MGGAAAGSGNRLDWSFLGSWYLKGLFVNQITPAGVSSDAMRALQVGKVTGHGPMVASLVASRMAGTLAMSWWALAAAVITRDRLQIPAVTGFVIFAAAMIVAWVLALVAELVRRRIPEHRTIPHAMGRFVRPFTRVLSSYRGHPHAVGRSIAAGIVAWGLNLFSMAAFALALHTQVSWSVFALVLPIALLATFIPISANGIGVREGLVILLLVQAPRRAQHGDRAEPLRRPAIAPLRGPLAAWSTLVEHRWRRATRRGTLLARLGALDTPPTR